MLFDDNIGFVDLDMFETNNNSLDNNPKLFDKSEGLIKGNMFKNEFIPYKNYKEMKLTPKSSREKLLLEILENTFAIIDLNLYLDLHPNDQDMLKKFAQLVAKSVDKEMEYVKTYGPIELIDSDSTDTFKWINDPWPWQKEGNI